MNHTKEPWEVTNVGMTLAGNDYPSVFSRELQCHICTCGDFFGITQVDNKANAERIALCVNACAGISDKALDEHIIQELMRTLDMVHNILMFDDFDDKVLIEELRKQVSLTRGIFDRMFAEEDV